MTAMAYCDTSPVDLVARQAVWPLTSIKDKERYSKIHKSVINLCGSFKKLLDSHYIKI